MIPEYSRSKRSNSRHNQIFKKVSSSFIPFLFHHKVSNNEQIKKVKCNKTSELNKKTNKFKLSSNSSKENTTVKKNGKCWVPEFRRPLTKILPGKHPIST